MEKTQRAILFKNTYSIQDILKLEMKLLRRLRKIKSKSRKRRSY